MCNIAAHKQTNLPGNSPLEYELPTQKYEVSSPECVRLLEVSKSRVNSAPCWVGRDSREANDKTTHVIHFGLGTQRVWEIGWKEGDGAQIRARDGNRDD